MTDEEIVGRMASAIQSTKIDGQRQRLSDEYCREMARAALAAIRAGDRLGGDLVAWSTRTITLPTGSKADVPNLESRTLHHDRSSR